MFIQLLINKIFLSVIISMGLAQGLKTLFKLFKSKTLDLKKLWETGGMPSSHAAIASSLFLSASLLEGFSNLTIITFFFSLLIIRDAFGLRNQVGTQAGVINKLTYKSKLKIKKLNEKAGHTPLQVLCGIFLGCVVTIIIFLI